MVTCGLCDRDMDRYRVGIDSTSTAAYIQTILCGISTLDYADLYRNFSWSCDWILHCKIADKG